METKRKALTVEINGDTTKLNKKLRKVRKLVKDINKELEKTSSLIRQIRY